MADRNTDRPCIHVCLAGGVDPALYRWVEIGAEEEGVPCRQVQISENGLISTAYATARSSRFQIGVVVAPDRVLLHEGHMPAEQPVLTFQIKENAAHICRLMGSNAARLVIRLPFRFDDEEQPFYSPERATRQSEPVSANRNRPAQNPATRPAGDNPDRGEIVALARAIVAKAMVRQKSPAPKNPPSGDLGDIEVKLIAKIVARILRERGMQ